VYALDETCLEIAICKKSLFCLLAVVGAGTFLRALVQNAAEVANCEVTDERGHYNTVLDRREGKRRAIEKKIQ
jgi:hypothetical protein